MQQQTERAAATVEACTRALQERLAELRAANPVRKMQLAPFVVAAFLELQQHQAKFNECAIGELRELHCQVQFALEKVAANG